MIKVKSLFISDLHLGNPNCQADKVLQVLRNYEFENLFIVGDFIDMTALKRKFYWHPDHSTVIQKVLRASRKGVKVIYVVGKFFWAFFMLLFCIVTKAPTEFTHRRRRSLVCYWYPN